MYDLLVFKIHVCKVINKSGVFFRHEVKIMALKVEFEEEKE